MKSLYGIALSLLVASASFATVNYDESANGDLSNDPAAPTALDFMVGSNTVTGTIGNSNDPVNGDRDFITFVVGPGQSISAINLLAWTPDNLGFAGLNSGNTSFIPSGTTNDFFLAGILPSTGDVGTDLLELFANASVTTNSLAAPVLDPGTYSFVVQQTTDLVQEYSLEFVLDGTVSVEATSWTGVKGLYR